MKFGVLGTANIARKSVIPAIEESEHQTYAVASREKERALAVAETFTIPNAYGSYDELLEDPELDAVYIPLPNAHHREWTMRAADRGLDVLCEKPLAVDADEAREMGDYCESRGVLLMEGFMYRYHPRTERAADIVANQLADVRLVTASFHFPLRGRPDDIRLNPELRGGSLMDVGCYPVNVSRLFLGEPTRVSGHAIDSRNCGVDTNLSGILHYDDDKMGVITCGFDTQTTQTYRVDATNGWVEVHNAFDTSGVGETTLEYAVDGRRVVETFDPADPYRLEIDHFARCVQSGERVRTDPVSGANNVAVIDALYESSSTGTLVAV